MRAAVFRGVRRMPVEPVPDPVAGPGDIVIDVRACGVCGSDLHAYTSGMFAGGDGQVMGHEFAGEVRDVGERVRDIAVGDRVTAVPIQPCGTCARCRAGLGHLCAVWDTRSIAFGLPGGFAERVRVPEAALGRNVHRLPDGLAFEAGALVEPLSVAVHAVRQAEPEPGGSAVVLGLGTIGLHIAQVLAARGVSPVIGVDRSPLRRSVAAGLGVTVVDDAAALDDEGSGLVFEVTGAAALLRRAVEVVRPRGTVVVVALYERPGELDANVLVHKEVTMRGTAMVTAEDFRTSLGLLSSGRAVAAPLITHRMPLDGIAEAFETQMDPATTIKVMITG